MAAMISKKIAVILVEPENPDNIGAVARAMKNTGFKDLRLVKPPQDWRQKGRKMAMNAEDVLIKGKACFSFEEAVKDAVFIIGTSRRRGAKRGNQISFFEAVEKVRALGEKKKSVALVFGKESKGLDNQTIKRCHAVTAFPVDSKYPSYNLAQAVLVFLFSIAYLNNEKNETAETESFDVSQKEIEIMMNRLDSALQRLGYVRGGANKLGRILDTFHRLIKRNGLKRDEAQMFMGLTRRLLEKLPN